jgi:hypothetical protein
MPDKADCPQPSFDMLMAAVVGVMVLLAGMGAWRIVRSGPAGRPVAVAAIGSSTGAASLEDARLSRLAVGTWHDSYQGERTLILRADGTATMVVELTGWKARLFTPRLELDIVWSIEDGKMHRRTVGGRPADKVAFVNQRAGVAVAEPILDITSGRMVLLDQDGSRRYTWRRAQ